MENKEILCKAIETIQRLGSAAQDCRSCARLTLCNAYQDGDIYHGCEYKWIHADAAEELVNIEKRRELVSPGADDIDGWYE